MALDEDAAGVKVEEEGESEVQLQNGGSFRSGRSTPAVSTDDLNNFWQLAP